MISIQSFAMLLEGPRKKSEFEDPKSPLKGNVKPNGRPRDQKCREKRTEVAPKIDRTSEWKTLGHMGPLCRLRDNPKMKGIGRRSEG
jgi:hypothetical protein